MHTTTPSGVSTQRGSFGEVACDSGDCLPRLACTMLLPETEKSEIGDFVWGELLVLSAGGATVGDYTYPCAGRHSSVRRTGISQGSGGTTLAHSQPHEEQRTEKFIPDGVVLLPTAEVGQDMGAECGDVSVIQ